MKKSYKEYGPIELAQDEKFILWVQGGGHIGDPFWNELLVQYPGKDQDFVDAFNLVNELKFRTRDVVQDTADRLWQAIDQKTISGSSRTQVKKLKFRNTIWYAAAAVGLLLIGFFLSRQNIHTTQTAFAENTELSLPDGTTVYLNADSKLTYNKKNWSNNRNVKLSGEAFFEVMKGSTFEVLTPLGNVTVLGTSFNVRARSTLEVSCFTGKVQVEPTRSPAIKLLPGQRVYQKEGLTEFQRERFDPEVEKYWRMGEIDFPATALSEVFLEVERQFNVQIELPEEIGNRHFSGKVMLKEITGALEDVCAPMQLRFEQREKRYRIFE